MLYHSVMRQFPALRLHHRLLNRLPLLKGQRSLKLLGRWLRHLQSPLYMLIAQRGLIRRHHVCCSVSALA